ncbi:hypothetical protein AB0C69_35730, partial [Actinomadura sp. NPDC048032]|uniref:hypothetical protein n=1 Tax=Actinomadura sp. NPDC048032 TaxID=3155747 RepID=UPI0033CD0723
LAGQDWTDAYRRHRRNLQLIGLNDPGRRWVLMNPRTQACPQADGVARYTTVSGVRAHVPGPPRNLGSSR